MSETTNLKLKKHDNVTTNTNQFDVENYMNGNWDKLDEFAGQVNGKTAELQEATLALQAELLATKKDLQASSLEGQAEGESLYLQDSSNARFREFEICGNSKQEKREGYNILDYLAELYNTQNGLEISKDLETGYITVNGTPTANYTNIKRQVNITDILEIGQTYTLWQEVYGSSANPGVYLQVREVNAENVVTNYFVRDKKVTFTAKEGCTYYSQLLTGTIAQTGTLTNYKNRYMLYEGTADKPYEQYGAMPSLEFPAEVKMIKDSVNVTVCNKNFFDKNSVIWERGKRINLNTGELEAGSLEWASTQNYIPVPSNTMLHFKGTVCYAGWRFYVHFYDANKQILKSLEIIAGTEWREVTFNTEEAKYIRLTFNPSKVDFDSIQLEEGSTATDYIEHKEQAFTVPVQQEMLGGDYFGVDGEHHVMRKIIVDGQNIKATQIKSTGTTIQFYLATSSIIKTDAKGYCNMGKQHNNYNIENTFVITRLGNLYMHFPVTALGDKEITDAYLNELLKQKYDEGTPLTFILEAKEEIVLPYTEPQTKVLNEIEQTLHSYKGGTHVYSTDAVSPIFNVKYTKDTEAYIKNEIANISRGVINNA